MIKPTLSAHSVLVVDDDPQVRALLGLGLLAQGLDVTLAGSAPEAVDLYRRAGFSLVLVSVRAPGLDGPRTLEALRRVDPAVRCCYLNGDAGAYAAAGLLAAGALSPSSRAPRLGGVPIAQLPLR